MWCPGRWYSDVGNSVDPRWQGRLDTVQISAWVPNYMSVLGHWYNNFLHVSSAPSFKMTLSFWKDDYVLNLIASDDGAVSASFALGQ